MHTEAINFRITREGQNVLGLHTGSSLTMFCEDDIGQPLQSFYSEHLAPDTCVLDDEKPKYYVRGILEIPSVTRNHSGMYVCKGIIKVVSSDQEARVFSDNLTPWELIVYGK